MVHYLNLTSLGTGRDPILKVSSQGLYSRHEEKQCQVPGWEMDQGDLRVSGI